MRRHFVRCLVVGIDAQLAERLTVIAAEPDGGLFEHAEVRELGAHRADGIVCVAHADVVPVEELLHLCG